MRHSLLYTLLALSVSASLAFPARAAPAAKPPVEAFFQNVELGAASLSPNGRYVAARVSFKDARRALVLFDLASMTPKVLARYSNGDVGKVFWLNEKRIGFTVVNIAPDVESTTSGLYAIDVDGKGVAGLAPAVVNQRSFAAGEHLQGFPSTRAQIAGDTPQTSDSMPVMVKIDGNTELGTLNTRSGQRSAVRAPLGTFSWLLDDSGALRVTVGTDGDLHTMRFLDPEHGWRKVGSFAPASAATLLPRAYIGNTLYVQAQNGADRTSLYRYSVERNALELPALIASPEFDIDGVAVSEGSRLVGFRINTDAESTVWFDPVMKALQADIDALLPATINRIERAIRSETPFVLIKSYSPIDPGDTLLFNRDTKELIKLGKALPGIVGGQLTSEMQMVHYPARDGMSIPAYVTLPGAELKKNLPTVILVGPYPWQRNAGWSFDPAVQFLASRGYAVIQPEARGARGYGAAHFKAGMRQWGLAMQDDLADSAKWAIARGIADPKRICIAGSVYGGYAAMMGLIKDPALFRCGVSLAGIVDIKLMFRNRWEEFPTSAYGDEIKLLVGDPARDLDQFNATSPLRSASRITQPVLLAYGARDVEVPATHGRQLYDAIKPGNPNAELIMFDKQGQAPSLEKNRAELWTRIEQFLQRNIGKAQP